MIGIDGKGYAPHRLPRVESPLLRSAPGDLHGPCAGRFGLFLGLPCWSQDTVVGAHFECGVGGGMSIKTTDLGIMWLCGFCHDLHDGRDPRGMTIREKYPEAFFKQVLRAVMETQTMLVESGRIIIPDGHLIRAF